MNHTPTPWKIYKRGSDIVIDTQPDDYPLLKMNTDDLTDSCCEANAAFIVKACNQHYGWKKFETLTPNGSEFVEDPERCFEHIKKQLSETVDAKKKVVKLSRINNELVEALKQIADGLENDARMYPDGNFPSADRFINRAKRAREALARAEAV